jgi:hypothetical protein
VRELLDRPITQPLADGGLRRLQQPVTGRIARAWNQSVNGQQQGAVVGSQREHRGIDPATGQELLERGEVRHG